MPEPLARIVIVGGGPAGRAAAALLPDARVIARPAQTAWHVEPGRLWIADDTAVDALPFDRLLVAAPAPQLLLALGCAMAGWQPVVDGAGRTSLAGVWAAGRILGATTPEAAAAQGRIAAQSMLGLPTAGTIAVTPMPDEPRTDGVVCDCLGITRQQIAASGLTDPEALADLFGLRAGACRMTRCGPMLGEAVRLAPAAPVALRALAARASSRPTPLPLQYDEGLR